MVTGARYRLHRGGIEQPIPDEMLVDVDADNLPNDYVVIERAALNVG